MLTTRELLQAVGHRPIAFRGPMEVVVALLPSSVPRWFPANWGLFEVSFTYTDTKCVDVRAASMAACRLLTFGTDMASKGCSEASGSLT